MITLDLPGFGHSPMPRETISISGYARMLDGLLDQLEIDAAAVVGNSMGGFIGAELAIAFPQRVERLVLVSAAGISTHAPRGSITRCARAARARAGPDGLGGVGGGRLGHDRCAARACATLRSASSSRHPAELPAALAAEQVRGAGKPGFIAGAGVDRRLRNPRAARRDRLPDADRLGRRATG